jgi:hypothetical protein
MAFRSEQYFFKIKNEGNMINEVNIEFITSIPWYIIIFCAEKKYANERTRQIPGGAMAL